MPTAKAGGGRRPDFFIVGAPKCGTTAMCHYLQQHSSVFMPVQKEAHFFGSDLIRYPHEFYVLDQEAYLALFRKASPEQRIGEASVMYLYSKLAAQEIKNFNEKAQIIVMLRNPADMLYAYHSQLFWGAYEDIGDFGEALAAEPSRRRGERLPPGNMMPAALYYRQVACFADQLERYFDIFGRDRVHVILYDDFRRNPALSLNETLAFLELSPIQLSSMPVVNANKVVLSQVFTRFLQRPPAPVRWWLDWLDDERRYKVLGRAQRLNTRYRPRPPLAPAIRQELVDEFCPQVKKLESLLKADLSSWRERRV